jgi:hypothetical protein
MREPCEPGRNFVNVALIFLIYKKVCDRKKRERGFAMQWSHILSRCNIDFGGAEWY